MAELFTAKYQILWAILLAAALFLPVRKLIWVLSVRRAERKQDGPSDEALQAKLKTRAGWTSALLCFVFAYFYTATIMGDLQ